MSVQQGPLDLSLLSDGICIITGAANGGIGFGIATRAMEIGMDILILDLRADVCENAANELRSKNTSNNNNIIIGLACDVTKESDLKSIVDLLPKYFGNKKRVSALFANAGVILPVPSITQGNIKNWQVTFDVNVLGVFLTIKTFLPVMQKSKQQCIITTTASTAGVMRGSKATNAYTSSKHAACVMTEEFASGFIKLSPQVRFHVLMPCIVRTGLGQTSQNVVDNGKKYKEFNRDDLMSVGMLDPSLAMTPYRHAQQVFDRIAAGEFYMITDNIRPYVDHDFKFNGEGLARSRFANILKDDFNRKIDHNQRPENLYIQEMIRKNNSTNFGGIMSQRTLPSGVNVVQGNVDLSNFKDTVCVVTGAANFGIGFGMCERACEYGMSIALLDLNQNIINGAVDALRKKYPNVQVEGFQCDVTNNVLMKNVANQVKAAFNKKRISSVFANAGVAFGSKNLLNATAKNVAITLNVNCIGVVNTLQAFVPILKETQKPGLVCTTASVAGVTRGSGTLSGYFASKHGATVITEGLSDELKSSHPNISCHVCMPCIVATPLMETSNANKNNETLATDRLESQLDVARMQEQAPELMGGLAMSPYNHARQVFDRIAAGEFYMICDNIRPYVDHDYPLNGAVNAKIRAAPFFKPDFQRSVDWDNVGFATSPMFRRVGELAREAAKARKAKKKVAVKSKM